MVRNTSSTDMEDLLIFFVRNKMVPHACRGH